MQECPRLSKVQSPELMIPRTWQVREPYVFIVGADASGRVKEEMMLSGQAMLESRSSAMRHNMTNLQQSLDHLDYSLGTSLDP